MEEKIRKHLLSEIHADITNFTDDTKIFKQGYLDSMGFMVLITFIEDEFGVKVSDTDMQEENFESVNAIAVFVKNHKK
jgi:acyl carrier protein